MSLFETKFILLRRFWDGLRITFEILYDDLKYAHIIFHKTDF